RARLVCEPAFFLAERSFAVPFDEALRRMDELVDGGEHVKLWWLPHTDRVQVYRMDRTERRGPTRGALATWLDESFLVRGLFGGLLWVGRAIPAWIPSFNRFVRSIYFKNRTRIGIGHRIFNTPMPP